MDPVTIALIGAGTMQAVGGLLGFGESKKQAAQARAQAQKDANREARQVRTTLGENYARLAASGVMLGGSPELFLTEQLKLGVQNVNDILEAGYSQARSIEAQGRQALFGAGVNAATTGFKAYQSIGN